MHRDIKPENIMIKRLELDKKEMTKRKTNIQPVLIDFGFAEYELN
jgi:serine/threonine protein kinase